MSTSRKRPLAVEGELESTKESKDKDKKSVTSSRPPKSTAKRRKTAEGTDTQKSQSVDAKGTGKGKRQAWTQAAIDAFFEGLLQHGKDFQKILKHMQSKQKKLNDPTIGNLTKDQVRFFYYRNWHKVELLLTSPIQQLNDSRRASNTKSSAPQTPVAPFSESNEDSAAEDQQTTEPETYLDSSVDELDPSSPTVAPGTAKQEHDGKACPSPAPGEGTSGGEKVTSEKSKEQVLASPGITDKSEGKVKDTVLVNGTKQSLDLVALICYNKLRKKSLGDHNIGKRLSELVFQGVTSVPGRVKGKRKAQIKIPNCGAFRGPVRKPISEDIENTTDSCPSADVNKSESVRSEGSKHTRSDGKVTVELKPLTCSTWLHVQALSHNPRVRMQVEATGSLSALRDYLTLRWKLDKGVALKFYSSVDYLTNQPTTKPPTTSQPHKPTLSQPPTSHPPSSQPTSSQASPFTHQSQPPTPLPPSPNDREAISLPATPAVSKADTGTSRECQSVPATPVCSSETTEVVDSEAMITDPLPDETSEAMETEVAGSPQMTKGAEERSTVTSEAVKSPPSVTLDNKPPVEESDGKSQCSPHGEETVQECSKGAKEKATSTETVNVVISLPTNGQPACNGEVDTAVRFSENMRGSEVQGSSTWDELAAKFGDSTIQLCYEISRPKQAQQQRELTDRLRATLKLVEFFVKRSGDQATQIPGLRTPPKRSPVISHRSPKVIEYMQTLNRHSPQKSPLSKYRRLKGKSPLKRASTTPTRTVKHVPLSYSSKETAAAPTAPSSTSAHTNHSSPTVITTLTVGDKKSQVIQLSSPKSIGSFADVKVQSLFPKSQTSTPAKTTSQSQVPVSLHTVQSSTSVAQTQPHMQASITPSSLNVSTQQTVNNVIASSLPISTTTSLPVIGPLTIQRQAGSNVLSSVPCLPTTTSGVLTSVGGQPQISSQRPTQGVRQMVSLHPGPLQPGELRIQPRVPNAMTQKQSVQLVTPTLATPATRASIMPRPRGEGSDGGGVSNAVSIMASLKPFRKPKRIKKPPARPGQPHQLVPRPLPFLRDLTLLPSTSVSAGASTSAAQPTSTPSQVTATSLPSLNLPRHSSPRKTTTALIQNQHLMLQLLQSYMLQQQRAQLGKMKAQKPVSEPTQTATSSMKQPASTKNTQAAATNNQQACEINEKELQSTVLDNFLAEGAAVNNSSNVSKLFNTSSDTVNQLLRGLSSVQPSESIQKLSEETADVLPTFAKALGDSLLSSKSKETLEEDGVRPACSSEPNTDGHTDGVVEKMETESDADNKGVPKTVSEDSLSQLPFLHDSASLNDILGTLTDSNFAQVADNGDVFEHIDFSDMFSQLKDVMTPEKARNAEPTGRGEDSQSSIGNLLDYVNGQPKPPVESAYNAPVDPACRSFLEDNSVDFVAKFRELASTMEGRTSTANRE